MTTITRCIASANRTIGELGENYSSSIKSTNITTADFSSIFEIKMDENLINALNIYKNELTRVKEQLREIIQKIKSNQALIDQINVDIRNISNELYANTNKIRQANSQIHECKRDISRARNERQKEEAEVALRQARRDKSDAEANMRSITNRVKEFESQKNNLENKNIQYHEQKKVSENRIEQIDRIIKMF